MKKKESYKSIRNKHYKKYKDLSSSDAGYSPYTPSNLPAGFTAPKGAIINQGKGNFHVTQSNIGGGTLQGTTQGNFGGGRAGTGAQWEANQAAGNANKAGILNPSMYNPAALGHFKKNSKKSKKMSRVKKFKRHSKK